MLSLVSTLMGDYLEIPATGCPGGVVDHVSELEISEPSSNFSGVHYIHPCLNTFGNGMNQPLPPQLWVNY